MHSVHTPLLTCCQVQKWLPQRYLNVCLTLCCTVSEAVIILDSFMRLDAWGSSLLPPMRFRALVSCTVRGSLK